MLCWQIYIECLKYQLAYNIKTLPPPCLPQYWRTWRKPSTCRKSLIKFVSDLQQVGGFLRFLWFPPPIKLTATEILLKVALNTIKQINIEGKYSLIVIIYTRDTIDKLDKYYDYFI